MTAPLAPGTDGRWTVHGERPVYLNEWVNLWLVDVELPSGRRLDHHVVRFDQPAVGTVVADADRGVLLIWRHRFITDSWGWEVPAGGVDRGEDLEAAARRETLEETGWEPGPLRPVASYHPANGVSNQTFTCFVADGATHVGPPLDVDEATEVAWVPWDEVRRQVRTGGVRDGLSLTALLWVLAFGPS